MEIERKWLFDKNKIPIHLSKTITYYTQAYLSIDPEVRIRTKLIKGNEINNTDDVSYNTIVSKDETYMICLKSNGTMSRQEVQKELTKEEFESLKIIGNLKDEDFVYKKYWTIPIDKYILTVGVVMEDSPFEFCYGEIEFPSEEEAKKFVTPDWFGKDVTNDKSYKMKNVWNKYFPIKNKYVLKLVLKETDYSLYHSKNDNNLSLGLDTIIYSSQKDAFEIGTTINQPLIITPLSLALKKYYKNIKENNNA